MQIIQSIQNRIYKLRGERVMLDLDLAMLYEVETRVLNQAVKRNSKRFPIDFMFKLTKEEFDLFRGSDRLFRANYVITICDDIPKQTS